MIQSLTGLRGYAALLVFISHLFVFQYFVGLTDGPVFNFFDNLGAVGVSIFFVLSGFILTVNYIDSVRQGRFDIKRFYVARFARIYPVFLLTTLLAVPIEMVSPKLHFSWQSLGLTVTLAHCFDPVACSAFNAPGWSLSVEALFYGLFPLLILAFRKPVAKNLVLLYALIVSYFVLVQWLGGDNYASHVSFPLNRVLEFVTGMSTGYCYGQLLQRPETVVWWGDRWPRIALIAVFPICLIAMALVSLPINAWGAPWTKLNYLFYVIPAAVSVLSLALAEKAGISLRAFTHPWAILAGEISYAFYLLHHLMLRYTKHLVQFAFGLNLAEPHPVLGLLIALGVLLISVVLSYGIYTRFEKPMRQRILGGYHWLSGKTGWLTRASYG